MNRKHFGVIGASLLITACGSGDTGLFGTTPSATTGSITPANALITARAAWEIAVASGELTDLGGALGFSTSTPGDFSKVSSGVMATGRLINILQKVPFGPDVYPCLTSGTTTISGDIADLNTLTLGDTFRVVYEVCNDGAGEVLDGTIDMTVNEFTGDLVAGTYLLSMDAVSTNLQVATGTDTITSNGDTTVNLDTTETPYIDASTSGTSLSRDSSTGSNTISGYQSNTTVDGNSAPAPFTLTASGTLDSTDLEGTVQYSTPQAFAGVGTEFPSEGRLRVQGVESALDLVAIDNINVDIEIDSNGDGTIDVTVSTTWQDIIS